MFAQKKKPTQLAQTAQRPQQTATEQGHNTQTHQGRTHTHTQKEEEG